VVDRPSEHELQRVWNANAGFWDDAVGSEGNDFHRLLVAPTQMELLAVRPADRVLDLACGNGQFGREMARTGAAVLGVDFSTVFLDRARGHAEAAGLAMEFQMVDVTEERELLALGPPASFDAAVCTMAFHDIADLRPMALALPILLGPSGRLVFSVTHPCFNGPAVGYVTETIDVHGELRSAYSIKLDRYAGLEPSRGLGIVGQPEPHWYFPRTVAETFAPFFTAGWMVDAIVEPVPPPGTPPSTTPYSWRNRPSLPPVLAARLRPPSR
jgi:SAM-dependent methyltransferase